MLTPEQAKEPWYRRPEILGVVGAVGLIAAGVVIRTIMHRQSSPETVDIQTQPEEPGPWD